MVDLLELFHNCVKTRVLGDNLFIPVVVGGELRNKKNLFHVFFISYLA